VKAETLCGGSFLQHQTFVDTILSASKDEDEGIVAKKEIRKTL
jgi:hypothetical protein